MDTRSARSESDIRGMATASVVALMALALSGCLSASAERGGESAVGAFAGGQASTVSGPGTLAIEEALGGGLIAGEIGSALRSGDRRRALEAEYRALEHSGVGQQVSWRSSDDSHAGEVVAAAPYRVGSQDCRQYIHTIRSAGTTRSARGTACRNPDGSWTLLT